MCWGVSLKSMYVDACSMRNECDDLEMCVQFQGHDHTGITETWQDGSHDWSIAMEGCGLFGNRLGR